MDMEKMTSVIIDMTANIAGKLQQCLESDVTGWQSVYMDKLMTQLWWNKRI